MGASRAAENDQVTGGRVTVGNAHSEIHNGASFHAGIASADMSAGDIGFRFTTPATGPRMHMVISASTEDDGALGVFEGGTPTGGSSYVPLNRNRGSAAVTAATGFNSGAVATGGSPTTLLSKGWGSAGGGPNASGGGERGVIEWVLKANTVYFVILSGTSASAGWLELDWYEHTG